MSAQNQPSPTATTSAKDFEEYIDNNSCGFCMDFGERLKDYKSSFLCDDKIKGKFCSEACFEQFKKIMVYSFVDKGLELIDINDNSTLFNSQSNDGPQDVFFNLEDIKHSSPFLTWLQAATHLYGVESLTTDEQVKALTEKVRAELVAKKTNRLEKERSEEPSFEEVCMVIRNLWHILKNEKVNYRSEAFENCIGFLNSWSDFVPEDLAKEFLSQRVSIVLIAFLLNLKREMVSKATAGQSPPGAKPALKDRLSEAQEILDVLIFKKPFSTAALTEKVEVCSFEISSSTSMNTFQFNISNYYTIQYQYKSEAAWSRRLKLSEAISSIKNVDERVFEVTGQQSGNVNIGKQFCSYLKTGLSTKNHYATVRNVPHVLFDTTNNKIINSNSKIHLLEHSSKTKYLVPLLNTNPPTNVETLEANNLICRFEFKIFSMRFFVFAAKNVLIDEVLDLASIILEYLFTNFTNIVNLLGSYRFVFQLTLPSEPDQKILTCGEVFLNTFTPLKDILKIEINGQNMQSTVLNINLGMKTTALVTPAGQR
jgi:hypothetical protein